jgi:hypothetical protein
MKKHKFNWVDGLVILLVVLLIAGAVYKFRGNNVTSSAVPMEPVTYTVAVSNVRSGMADAFREGDTVYDGDSGNAVGTIAKVEISDSRVIMTKDDGTAVWGTREDRYDVVLTVEAQATVSGNTCLVNRIYQLNVGSNRSLYTKYASWTGRITDIQFS